MKKLTLTQKITLGLTVIAFIVSRLEMFGLTAKTIAIVTEIYGIVKFVYDTYVSYTEKEVLSFGKYMSNKEINISSANDLENWKKSQ